MVLPLRPATLLSSLVTNNLFIFSIAFLETPTYVLEVILYINESCDYRHGRILMVFIERYQLVAFYMTVSNFSLEFQQLKGRFYPREIASSQPGNKKANNFKTS